MGSRHGAQGGTQGAGARQQKNAAGPQGGGERARSRRQHRREKPSASAASTSPRRWPRREIGSDARRVERASGPAPGRRTAPLTRHQAVGPPPAFPRAGRRPGGASDRAAASASARRRVPAPRHEQRAGAQAYASSDFEALQASREIGGAAQSLERGRPPPTGWRQVDRTRDPRARPPGRACVQPHDVGHRLPVPERHRVAGGVLAGIIDEQQGSSPALLHTRQCRRQRAPIELPVAVEHRERHQPASCSRARSAYARNDARS